MKYRYKRVDIINVKYQISTAGNLTRLSSGVIKRPHINPYGYLTYIIYNRGKRKTVFQHRLIAQAFIPNLDNKPQVNHIDGNKLNNSIENLEWCTAFENMHHAFAIGLIPMNGKSAVKKGKDVICLTCGTIFYKRNGYLSKSNGDNHYCSKACFGKRNTLNK